jgi:hypothetical protein
MMGRAARFLAFTAAAALAAALPASCSYLPDGTALNAGVTVTESRAAMVVQASSGSTHSVGFMFYPGGLVDPHAYLPWLSDLAAGGIPVILAKAPGNLAAISPDAGLPLKALLPGVASWVVGGHSLGGAMAAWSIHDHPSAWAGLVLLAAYPASDRSLAAWSGPVLSLSASNDGLATPQKIVDTLALLPPAQYTVTGLGQYSAPAGSFAVLHQIGGGNHGQFGSYGAQDGDGTALISPAAQHAEMVQYIGEFFTKNGW